MNNRYDKNNELLAKYGFEDESLDELLQELAMRRKYQQERDILVCQINNTRTDSKRKILKELLIESPLSNDDLAYKIGTCVKTVRNHSGDLEEHGFVERFDSGKGFVALNEELEPIIYDVLTQDLDV